MTSIPKVELNDGQAIPRVGFGVFQVPPEETEAAVSAALETGYRSIDTAAIYRNEEAVGRAIASSGVPRDELFITTKLWNTDQGREATLEAFDSSLRRLGLDHLDLYLIHWPAPERDLYVETWRTFEELRAGGRVTSIGVSNFRVRDLERLIAESETVPAVNQIELHPMLVQAELREFHAAQGIATEAWSPLAKAAILAHPVLSEISAEIGRTASQVVLRWHLQLGNIVIPKTVTPRRMAENLGLFDFELTPEQMKEITALDGDTRTGPDPNTFNG